MSLTESLSIKYSSARKYKIVPLSTAAPQDNFPGNINQIEILNNLADLLDGCGWDVEPIKATTSVSLPFGLPVKDPGGVPGSGINVGCASRGVVALAGVQYVLYDPQNVPVGTNCVMVPLGITSEATVNNLAAALSGTFNTSVAPEGVGFRIDMEAAVGGPEGNHISVVGGGSSAIASASQGGGYRFTSPVQASGGNSGQIVVSVTSLSNVFRPQRLQFDFELNGGVAQYHLDVWHAGTPITQYSIVANPYSFAIFDTTTDLVFPYSLRETSLYVAAPYIPPTWIPAYAVFIVGPHQLRTKTFWDGSIGPITTCLDAAPSTYGNSGGWPRLLALRGPGPALYTPAGLAITNTAYLMMGANKFSTPQVVGQLWDCAVINDYVTGTGVWADGHRFVALSSQAGGSGTTRSSLLMRIPD